MSSLTSWKPQSCAAAAGRKADTKPEYPVQKVGNASLRNSSRPECQYKNGTSSSKRWKRQACAAAAGRTANTKAACLVQQVGNANLAQPQPAGRPIPRRNVQSKKLETPSLRSSRRPEGQYQNGTSSLKCWKRQTCAAADGRKANIKTGRLVQKVGNAKLAQQQAAGLQISKRNVQPEKLGTPSWRSSSKRPKGKYQNGTSFLKSWKRKLAWQRAAGRPNGSARDGFGNVKNDLGSMWRQCGGFVLKCMVWRHCLQITALAHTSEGRHIDLQHLESSWWSPCKRFRCPTYGVGTETRKVAILPPLGCPKQCQGQ